MIVKGEKVLQEDNNTINPTGAEQLPPVDASDTDVAVVNGGELNQITEHNEGHDITVIKSEFDQLAKEKPKQPDYVPGVLIYGLYKVLSFFKMKDFYNYIIAMSTYMVLMLGVPRNGTREGIITSEKAKQLDTEITRTKRDIGASSHGRGFLLIDIDSDDFPDIRLETAEAVYDLLLKLDPELKGCGIVVVPSSSQKYDTEDKSWHAYIKVSQMSEATVKRYGKMLQSNAWSQGMGDIKISKSGSILVRQIFDIAVFGLERLIIESVFSRDKNVKFHDIEPFIQEGNSRDISINLDADYKYSDSLIRSARLKAIPESFKVKAKYKAEKFEELLSEGKSNEEAQRIVNELFDNKRIHADIVIKFQDNTTAKAGDIKANPQNYVGKYCADPYYEEDGVAKAHITSSGDIYTYKHGGTILEIVPSSDDIFDKVTQLATAQDIKESKATIEHLRSLCSVSGLNKSEVKMIAKELKRKKYIDSESEFHVIKKSIFETSESGKLLDTDENLIRLCNKYNFEISYDVILKQETVKHHEIDSNIDNNIDTAISKLSSYAEREGLPKTLVTSHLKAISMNEFSKNPLVEMVEESTRLYKAQEEKVDYIRQFISCFKTSASELYTYIIFSKWLIQCVAAWYHDTTKYAHPHAKPKFESVLVLLGAQGLNKTLLLSHLLDFDDLRGYFKEGVKLNPSDKDSVKEAISYGIVELGELDATFRKSDIADLKAFFSMIVDSLRLVYDRAFSKFKRRTSFAATVNGNFFLVDPTGNRRYWPLELLEIDFRALEKVDMKMLWGQVGCMLEDGASWWLEDTVEVDQEVMRELNKIHNNHRQISPMEDYANEIIAFIEANQDEKFVQISPTRLLEAFNIYNPTKAQITELKEALLSKGLKPLSSGSFKIPKLDKFSDSMMSGNLVNASTQVNVSPYDYVVNNTHLLPNPPVINRDPLGIYNNKNIPVNNNESITPLYNVNKEA